MGVAIGCVIYECLEHEVDMYATVMFSYRVCMLILFRCVCKDSRGPGGLQVCGSEVETSIYTGNWVVVYEYICFLLRLNKLSIRTREGRVWKTCKDRLVVG